MMQQNYYLKLNDQILMLRLICIGIFKQNDDITILESYISIDCCKYNYILLVGFSVPNTGKNNF